MHQKRINRTRIEKKKKSMEKLMTANREASEKIYKLISTIKNGEKKVGLVRKD